jgi:hypothetical protein
MIQFGTVIYIPYNISFPKISLNAIIICSIYDEFVDRELHTFSEIAIASSTRQKNFENCKF